MTYVFRDAQRSEAKPLIGLYSESGCGKTYTALLLARGFVGPQGVIGMIETESGRGEAYSDPREYPEFAGPNPKSNYRVLPMRATFSPQAYGEAISAAEQEKLDALIIDSASHEWEGKDGVLAMAAINQAAHKKGPLIWQQPKQDHQHHFMLRFTQTPIPLVILCMRAKYPMQQKGSDWVRSTVLEPKQADDILFEMFVHGWIDSSHNFNLTRCTSRGLAPIFKSGEKITIETGRQMAAWAASVGSATAKTSAPSADEAAAHKRFTDLYGRAEIRARGGEKELRAFWDACSREERILLQSSMETLKKLAADSDAAVSA